MPIIVFSSADAPYDSFISLADANSYHALRATPGWLEATDDQRNAALVRATDYLKITYRFTIDPLADDEVNPLLAMATKIMAGYALSETLQESRSEAFIVEREEEGEGVGKERFKYSEGTRDRFPIVTKLLAPIVENGTSGTSYVGNLTK